MKDPRKDRVKLGVHAGKHLGSAALGWGGYWGLVERQRLGRF